MIELVKRKYEINDSPSQFVPFWDKHESIFGKSSHVTNNPMYLEFRSGKICKLGNNTIFLSPNRVRPAVSLDGWLVG